MILARSKAASRPARLPSDAQLVRQCLDGNEETWAILIDKYKNLIYSIPAKYGFPSDDASDIFQAVCLDLLTDLPKLRQPRALPAWLIQVTAHKCLHWKRKQQRRLKSESETQSISPAFAEPEAHDNVLQQVKKQQALREALGELTPRCRQILQMLFYETPRKPYQEIARSFGLATGSLGSIRGRCLDQLRRRLEKKGFR